MALNERKYSYNPDHVLRDTRPYTVRIADALRQSDRAGLIFMFVGVACLIPGPGLMFLDLILVFALLYAWWLKSQDRKLPAKMPSFSKLPDLNNTGGGRSGKAEGILFLGNHKDSKEEVWFTNSDVRTHMLYLGTTGSGKTEGLKSMVTNALTWGSGFVYIDGKADTDLWSSLSSLCRRFGRDDDLFVLNYMTGNSDKKAPSNTLNPFSSGSASYLTNMLVSLMPASEGDNAMWKERAVSLLSSIMPALTYLRDNHDVPLSVSSIRFAMNFPEVVKLSRNEVLPERLRRPVRDYLNELPGYADAAFDDNGQDKPLGPNTPQVDTQVPKQQHGYLTMQFTRSLQSLGDDYGYIFDVDNADIDMIDIVLNRRILVVLIPALEKSGDETANLGKIVAATLKGMMGTTLGATVEGETSTVIENKPTHSATPFMTVFDEVGYYATEGMAVMAAQARSLGFALIYAAQDLPALEKRVKEEARSITANCNIKIFGKLEDPTQTKEFFEKTVGKAIVTQVSGFEKRAGSLGGAFETQSQASVTFYDRASYDGLLEQKEGEAVLAFAGTVNDVRIFYCNPGHAKAMRVQKYLGFEKPDDYVLKNLKNIAALRDRLTHKTWTAAKADIGAPIDADLETLIEGFALPEMASVETGIERSAMALTHIYARKNPDAVKPPAAKKPEQPPAQPETETETPSKPVQEAAPNEGNDADGDLSWDDIMGDDAEDGNKDGESGDRRADAAAGAEEDGENGGGSGDSRTVSMDSYVVDEALEEKAETGVTVLPDTLTDEVRDILKSAADTLTAGLFSPPTLDRYAQGGSGDSRGFKAKTVSPTTQPGKTGR